MFLDENPETLTQIEQEVRRKLREEGAALVGEPVAESEEPAEKE